MVKTQWDYTDLAEAYLKRPDYADRAIDRMLEITGLSSGAPVCDVGAGVGHLTIKLAERRLNVVAVEPNKAMMERGVRRTAELTGVRWYEGTGEHTGQPTSVFDLVTFGSSFNVVDRAAALEESSRILKPMGWFACMWNHRSIDDPTQASIETVIKRHIPNYDYGVRREDQTSVIQEGGLFHNVQRVEALIYHSQTLEDCLEAWRSHATLKRQAEGRFDSIIEGIEQALRSTGDSEIQVPYTTRVWVAQRSV